MKTLLLTLVLVLSSCATAKWDDKVCPVVNDVRVCSCKAYFISAHDGVAVQKCDGYVVPVTIKYEGVTNASP